MWEVLGEVGGFASFAFGHKKLRACLYAGILKKKNLQNSDGVIASQL